MTLKGTASMLPNNLAVCKAKILSYAVIHKSVVCVNTILTAGNILQKQIACKGDVLGVNSTIMQVHVAFINSGRKDLVGSLCHSSLCNVQILLCKLHKLT